MIAVPFELAHHDDNNPLDMIEELAVEKAWAYTRHDDATMSLTLPGQKDKYQVAMEWQEEFSALLIACTIPLEIPDAGYEMAVQAVEQINQNLWLGHFDFSDRNKYPCFRHTLLLRMVPVTVAADLAADALDLAVAECNRFYSTFRLAKDGDVRLQDDLDAAVFETIGEA